MAGNWQERSIAEVSEIIGGGTPKTTNSDYWNGNIPWLSVVDFNDDNRWVYKTEKSITDKGLQESSTKVLKAGQLIISARGTVGALAQLSKDMAFNQSCYGLNAKDGYALNDYLYYAVKNAVSDIKRNTHGAVFDTITRDTLDHIKIPVPSVAEQKEIAAVLSSVDQRIELNHQMNEVLEETAQALFKSWFVDFDPVQAKMEGKKPEGLSDDLSTLFPSKIDGGIPSGWREDSIYSCATFINGAAYKNMHFSDAEDALPVIKIAELKAGIGQGTKFTNTDLGGKYLIDSGDILFSWSGSPETSIDTFLWVGGKGWLNQHIFKVVTDSAEMRTFTFFLLKHLKPIFVATAKDKQTTGLGHVTVQDLKRLKAVYPDQKVLKAFSEVATPLLGRIQKNMEQIADLNKIRDSLLPKLISGELRVSDAAPSIKEAV